MGDKGWNRSCFPATLIRFTVPCHPTLAVRFGSSTAGDQGSPVQDELLGTSYLAHFWMCAREFGCVTCGTTCWLVTVCLASLKAHRDAMETPLLVWRHFLNSPPWNGEEQEDDLQHGVTSCPDLSPSAEGRSLFPENMVLSESSDPSPARLTLNSRTSPSGEDACLQDEVSQGQPEETLSQIWSGIQKINHSGTGLQCQRCFVPGWKTPRTGQAYGDCAHLPLSFN